jgi:hypothetical protein
MGRHFLGVGVEGSCVLRGERGGRCGRLGVASIHDLLHVRSAVSKTRNRLWHFQSHLEALRIEVARPSCRSLNAVTPPLAHTRRDCTLSLFRGRCR